MTRIEREKTVVARMIAIYCRRHHPGNEGLCDDCRALLDYARRRLDHCPKGENKTSCRKCATHCYAPSYREKIRMVMKYTGPRMIFHHPVSALRHLLAEMR